MLNVFCNNNKVETALPYGSAHRRGMHSPSSFSSTDRGQEQASLRRGQFGYGPDRPSRPLAENANGQAEYWTMAIARGHQLMRSTTAGSPVDERRRRRSNDNVDMTQPMSTDDDVTMTATFRSLAKYYSVWNWTLCASSAQNITWKFTTKLQMIFSDQRCTT